MPATPTIYTYGYGNSRLEMLVDLVCLYGIDAVIDVRRSPVCRWSRDWNRRTLCTELLVAEYEHEPTLGNDQGAQPSQWIPYQGQQAADSALRSIAKRVARGEDILLLCAEADPERCHRRAVAKCLAELTGAEVVHLSPQDAKNAKCAVGQ